MSKNYIAVDLGASSGRVMVGMLEDGKLTLKEMNRFWNGPTEIDGTLYWDFVHLFRNIKDARIQNILNDIIGHDTDSISVLFKVCLCICRYFVSIFVT